MREAAREILIPRVGRRAAPWALALLVVSCLQVVLLTRLLHVDPFFDEGVYLLSTEAVRHGEELGRQVFASQPPAFYDLLRLLSYVFPFSLGGMRAAIVATSLLAVPGAFLAGRRLVGPLAGVAACALLVIAPPFPLWGSRIFADTPALALGTLAVGLAAVGSAELSGAVLALAILTKLSAATAAPTVVLLLLWAAPRRRRAVRAAAGAAAVLVLFLVVHRNGLAGLWNDNVSYHETAARSAAASLPNGHELASFFNPRTPFLWLLALGLAGTFAAPRRALAVWLWPVAGSLFVLTHKPLHENHLLTLPFSFALAGGIGLGAGLLWLPRRYAAVAAGACALAFCAGYVQQVHNLARSRTPVDPHVLAAARLVHALVPAGGLVVSDEPYVAFVSGRRVPADLVDTAGLRFRTGYLTPRSVEKTIAEYRVEVVVAGRAFVQQPELMSWIRARGRQVARFGEIGVYRLRP